MGDRARAGARGEVLNDAPAAAPRVVRLRIFPIKSLDGAEVASAPLVERGALAGDRRIAIVDEAGGWINGKREPRVHALRVVYDGDLAAATFASAITGERATFRLDGEDDALTAYLCRHFGRPVRIVRDDAGGFPDDANAPGPTVISTATLAAVASWFPDLSVDDAGRRLRANIEVDGVPAFWEDRLFGAGAATVPFRIGAAAFAGTNPCARCIVPSRDPMTGAALAGFQRSVAERRAATLPSWAARDRFDHFYRLAVNTRPAGGPLTGVVRLGDEVSLGLGVEAPTSG